MRKDEFIKPGSTVFASFDKLKQIVETHTSLSFVWPEEGEFSPNGKWRFNATYQGFQPLMIDPTTAQLLVLSHKALLTDSTREKVERIIARSRGTFGTFVEICWRHVK